ncbi:LOW QUALITY PROTEIN: putative pre-mRNA-splicing factor ATP-dependent RNA helicase DHX32 [Pangshura tecta]
MAGSGGYPRTPYTASLHLWAEPGVASRPHGNAGGGAKGLAGPQPSGDRPRGLLERRWGAGSSTSASLLGKIYEGEIKFLTFSSGKHYFSELFESSNGDEEEMLVCEDDLEHNPFDGLPYSSHYYKFMKEREELPFWKEYASVESLLHNQTVIVLGDAKSGKSSQGESSYIEYLHFSFTLKISSPRIRLHYKRVCSINKSQEDMCKQILGTSSSGKLFCLYPGFTYKEIKPGLSDRIQDSNLTSIVLFLKRMDLAGLGHGFIKSPAPENLMQGLEDLDFGTKDNDGNLFEFGIIRSFPQDPQLSKSILASCEFDMLTIAAMEEDTLTCWQKIFHPTGDHYTLINVYKAYRDTNSNSTSQCKRVHHTKKALPNSRSMSVKNHKFQCCNCRGPDPKRSCESSHKVIVGRRFVELAHQ